MEKWEAREVMKSLRDQLLLILKMITVLEASC
jgi:hypothetical protein